MNKQFLFIVAILFCLPAQAEWSKQYQFDYIMGDGDTKGSARQAAIEQIKLKASSEAGTYVQSTSTLNAKGELTESVQMVGASMVKIQVKDETLSVNPTGQAVLNIVVVASLDDSELSKRIRALQEDKEKARQVKVLRTENDTLRKELEGIRAALAGKADQARVAELLTKQDKAIRKLENNVATVAQVFERGTLLQLANRNASEFEQAKAYLDESLYGEIMKTPIYTNVDSVEKVKDGYVALVRVGWSFRDSTYKPVLNRYFHTNYFKKQINFYAYENTDSKGPHLLTERLYEYLASKGVDLKVTLAGKTVRIPVFYATGSSGCDTYKETRGEYARIICLASQAKDDPDFVANQSLYTNPIRIRLTQAEAERATNVEASWVLWEAPKGSRIITKRSW